MRALILGDGANEQAALPLLVRRLNHRVEDSVFRQFRGNPRIKFHGRGDGLFKKAVRWMFVAQSEGFDAVIILVDHDTDATRPRQMTEAQEFDRVPLPPRACGVAIMEFDAWFLADEQALTRTLGHPVGRQPDPEHLADPKGVIDGLIASSSYSGRSALYSSLAASVDLDQVRRRCPNGFAPFAERVEALDHHG